MNATGNRQPNEGREGVPPGPPVENIAAQAQPQDLEIVDMANDYPPPLGHLDRIIGDNAGIVQDGPAHWQAHAAPPSPVCTGLTLPHSYLTIPFPDELPRQIPDPNEWASEVLRQLAILYLHDPSSRVARIHMEPGQADGVMVVIALRLSDI